MWKITSHVGILARGVGDWVRGFYACLGIGAVIAIIHTYATLIYPQIPQAYGGAQWRCALVDMDTSRISEDSRARLFDADSSFDVGSSADSSPVGTVTGESTRVIVYYVTNDWLMVQKAQSLIEGTDDLDRDVINTITWLPKEECTGPF
jgi:hypothetical protein